MTVNAVHLAQDGPGTRSPALVDVPTLPAIVDGWVSHRRWGAGAHRFRHRAYLWLVDLDRMPRQPWYLRPFAGFDAADHLGSGPRSAGDLKVKVLRFLSLRGVHMGEGSRILMLANARVLGHVFDPLTVYWCLEETGGLRCIVAEVHNTYGERHAYLLEPDRTGAASVDKAFYVSPFNDVTGTYALRFVLTGHKVVVDVDLTREGRRLLRASFVGTPTTATTGALVRALLRRPAMPHKVTALIRLHGIRLWLRRLPLVQRPTPTPQEGVS